MLIFPFIPRLNCAQIKDYEGLIDQISHVVRPGGVIDIMEWDFGIHDVNKQRIPLSLNQKAPPWLDRFLALVESAVRKRGGDVDAVLRMETFVQNNPNYEQVVHQDFWVPIGPWMKDDPDMIRIGIHMRADVLVCCQHVELYNGIILIPTGILEFR